MRHRPLLPLLALALLLGAVPAYASGLVWSTFLSGGGADNGYAVAADGNGNIVSVGSTTSTNYPTTAGAAQRTNGGGTDIVVTKLASDGATVLWSTYFGASGEDIGRAVATGPNGDVFVTGYTGSANFPVTAGAWKTTFAGAADGFVARFSGSTGALVYSTFVGGSWNDSPRGIGVDASGCAVIGGFTNSNDFPTTSGVVRPSRSPGLFDGSDGFVTKISANGSSVVYSTFLGTNSGTDQVLALALDASGCATVTGWTASASFPTTAGAFDRTLTMDHKAFVTRLNATATGYVFSTYLGGTSYNTEGDGVAVDAAGAAYVTGCTSSSDFPTTSGAPQRTLATGPDAFISKISANGSSLVWSTYLGGSGSDCGYGITCSSGGQVAVVGSVASANFPTTAGAFRTSLVGSTDGFSTVINATGTHLVYSTYLGSSGTDCANGVAIQSSGHVVVGGATDNASFPSTSMAHEAEQSSAGVNDIFVSSLDAGLGGATAVWSEPAVLSSLQVGPNPFRSSTSIRLTIARSQHLVVRVVDAQGRLVRQLTDGVAPAGTNEVAWDGLDEHGNDAGVGVFFVQAQGDARIIGASTIVRLR
jgi:hypothetical protein